MTLQLLTGGLGVSSHPQGEGPAGIAEFEIQDLQEAGTLNKMMFSWLLVIGPMAWLCGCYR